MKRIMFILIIGLVYLSSCGDFLTEEPRSEMRAEEFFTSSSHAYDAVNILYRRGCANFYSAGIFSGSRAMLGSYMTGLFDNEYKGQEVQVQHSQNLTLNGHNLAGYFDEIWDECYNAISKANLAIKNIPNTPGLSDIEKSNLIAQAKFFRAFNYFYLIKTFGDVPLILEAYSSLENMYVERTSTKLIYDQIIVDLLYAMNQGGLNDLPMPKNEFRISKGSVAILLADVYLNMSGYPVAINKYKEAAAVARIAINSENYRLIMHHGHSELNSAYSIMRRSDFEDEYMYTVEYDENIETNGAQPAICYPTEAISWGIFKYSVTNNAFAPSKQVLWFYNKEKDLRIQEKQFFHSSLTYTEDGVEITREFKTAPYLWHDDEALFNTGKTSKDMVVYRYAELLLIAAEAIARTEGVTPEAVRYLTDVRSRAYWETDRNEIEAALSVLSVENFIFEVWKERLREFPLECKMWSDIQRTRKFPVTTEATKGEITFVDAIGHTTIWGKTIEKKHLLFPISENEIQRNPNLIQNPGY